MAGRASIFHLCSSETSIFGMIVRISGHLVEHHTSIHFLDVLEIAFQALNYRKGLFVSFVGDRVEIQSVRSAKCLRMKFSPPFQSKRLDIKCCFPGIQSVRMAKCQYPTNRTFCNKHIQFSRTPTFPKDTPHDV